MTRMHLAGVLALGVIALALPLAYTAEQGAGQTVTGILVDTKCYVADHANITNKHGDMEDCGTICAKSGIPVGVVEGGKAGGKLHILLISSHGLAPHVGKKVTVLGKTMEGGLMPEKITVTEASGKTTEVKLSPMM